MSVLLTPVAADEVVDTAARAVLRLVASMHEAETEQELAVRVLTGLGPLVHADSISWNEIDARAGTGTSTVFLPGAMVMPAPRRRFAVSLPSGAADVAASAWQAWLPTLAGDDRLTMTAEPTAGDLLAVGCTRWDGLFDDRDAGLVQLVRPHLAAAVDHVRLRFARRATEASLGTLTAREREVLALLSDGRTNREIGVALFINARTVEKHIEHIRDKLGARSRTEAAAIFVSIRAAPAVR